jgi:hypothetical protein
MEETLYHPDYTPITSFYVIFLCMWEEESMYTSPSSRRVCVQSLL